MKTHSYFRYISQNFLITLCSIALTCLTTLMARADTNLLFFRTNIFLPGLNWWTNVSVVGDGGTITVSNLYPDLLGFPAIIATNAALSELWITNAGGGDLLGNYWDNNAGPGPKVSQTTTITDCHLTSSWNPINFHGDLTGGTNLFQVRMHNVELRSTSETLEQNNVVGDYDSCRWFAKNIGGGAFTAGLVTGTNRISNTLLSATGTSGSDFTPNCAFIVSSNSAVTFNHCIFHIEPSSIGNGGFGDVFSADAALSLDYGNVYVVIESCLFELNSIGGSAPVSMVQSRAETTGTVKLINCFYYPETNGVIVVNNSSVNFIIEGGNLTPANFYNPSMVQWVDASTAIQTQSGGVINFQSGQQHRDTSSNLSITGFSDYGDGTHVKNAVLTVHNTGASSITISWPASVRNFVTATSPITLAPDKVWRATWIYDGQTNLFDVLQQN